MGRPRKSEGLHRQDGTYRPDRHEGRLVVNDGRPSKPRGMNKNESWMWDTITKGLPKECFAKMDVAALRIACKCWDVWLRYCDEDNPQRFYKGLAAAKQMQSILSHFGWTPSDREKLKAPASKGDDDDKKFFGVAG